MKRLIFLIVLASLTTCKNEKEFELIYFDNGVIQTKIELKDGKRNGELLSYYPSGNLKIKSNVIDGIQNGMRIDYYEDSNIKSIASLKEDQIIGEFYSYYPNGNIKLFGNYSSLGTRDGTELEFFENDSGKIQYKYKGILFQDKEIPICITEYNRFGKIIKEDGKVEIIRDSDTIKLGDEVTIGLKVKYPKFENSKAHIGNYDMFFNLVDSSDYKIIDGIGHIVDVQFTADSLGKNYLRGYMEDYEIETQDENGGYTTIGSVNNYFEYEYFVIP